MKCWENKVCSDETKTELFGCHNRDHQNQNTLLILKEIMENYQIIIIIIILSKKRYTNGEVWRQEHQGVGLFFQLRVLACFI